MITHPFFVDSTASCSVLKKRATRESVKSTTLVPSIRCDNTLTTLTRLRKSTRHRSVRRKEHGRQKAGQLDDAHERNEMRQKVMQMKARSEMENCVMASKFQRSLGSCCRVDLGWEEVGRRPRDGDARKCHAMTSSLRVTSTRTSTFH